MGGGLGRGVEDVYVVLRLQEGWIKGRENGLYPKNRTSLLISYHWTNKASPFTYAIHALLYPC
jgi:hypothetical protein